MTKKNIVFFIADQLRKDSLGCFGSIGAKTPNYDNLAADGIAFNNAFCQNPVCVPSRCSFNTGWYPHCKGHRTIHYFLDDGDPSMMKSLKKNGYNVYLMGKSHYFNRKNIHEINDTCNYEYIGRELTVEDIHGKMEPLTKEEINQNPYYYSFYNGKMSKEKAMNTQDDLVINRVEEMILNNELKEPFCLYISLNLPHPPYEVEEPWFSLIDRNMMEIHTKNIENLVDKPSTLYTIRKNQNLHSLTVDDFKEIKATYYGMVSKLDYQLGRVIKALKKINKYDDSNLIAFSDHGDFTGDYGLVEKTQNTFEDCLINVPLIIKPARNNEYLSRICDSLVELNDIPATIAEIAGYEIDYTQFGKSLVHLYKNDEIHHDYVLCEGGRIKGEIQAMEGYSSFSSIYWPRMESQNQLPDHTKAFMVRDKTFKYVYRLYEKDEFYDLDNDRYEEHNEIDNLLYSKKIKEMKEWLLKKLIQTTDVVDINSMIKGRIYGKE